jgi:hypothetical protein
VVCVLNVVSGEIKALIKVDMFNRDGFHKSGRRYRQQLLVADRDAIIHIHGWHSDTQLHQNSLLVAQ